MKRLHFPLALLIMLFLIGCSTPYVVELQDGTSIIAVDEPDFDDDSGYYEFENEEGKEIRMNKDVIKSIREK